MGVTSLSTVPGGPRTLYMRTDPNSCEWAYNLVTKEFDTYGGRVVQLLSVNLDTMTIQAEAGGGGPQYLQTLILYFRDLALWQRNTQQPVTFKYPTRNWQFKVFVESFALMDQFGNVNFPYSMTMKIQQDITGVLSSSIMSSAIANLQDGIGYTANQYNDPSKEASSNASQEPPIQKNNGNTNTLLNTLNPNPLTNNPITNPQNPFYPNQTSVGG